MTRSVLLHSVALGISLIAAYLIWTRVPPPSGDSIQVLNLRSGIDVLTYKTPVMTAEVQQQKDDAGNYYWVSVTKQPPPRPQKKPPKKPAQPGDKPSDEPSNKAAAKDKKDDKAAEATTAAEPAEPPKVTRFKGNETTSKRMKALARLTAVRSLGKLDEAKLEELGLKEGKKTLILKSGSVERAFTVGETAYGSSDFYARDQSDGTVYVLGGDILRELDHSEFRYVDRSISGLKVSDIEKLTVKTNTAPTHQKTLIQHGLHKAPGAQFWTEQDSDKPSEQIQNWVDQLSKLSVREYIESEADLPQIKPIVTVTIEGTQNRDESFTIYRKDADSDGGSQYYAKGTHTRTYAKLLRSSADQVVRDLDLVLGDNENSSNGAKPPGVEPPGATPPGATRAPAAAPVPAVPPAR